MIKSVNLNFVSKSKSILNNVDLDIKKGEKIALLGASGSGKTSLIHCLLGLYPSTFDSIFIDGQNLNNHNLKNWRAMCSYTGQSSVFYEETVEEIFKTPFRFSSNKDIRYNKDEASFLVKICNLNPDILQENPAYLSGGEKQRIAIIRALLLKKEVIFLDEITSALDKKNKKIIMDLFIKEKSTIISISHDPDWLDICSRSIEMNSGTIIRS